MRIKKFNEWDSKLQKTAKTVGAIMLLSPIALGLIKETIPYLNFIVKGPELVNNVKELKEAMLVTNSALSADMEDLDSIIYNINWKDHNYTGILKESKSGNVYVFVKDGEIGVQIFGASYDYDNRFWYFIDFEGNRIDLK